MTEAVARLLDIAARRVEEAPAPPEPTIPVSFDGWEWSLVDVGLVEGKNPIASELDVLQSAPVDFRAIREATDALVDRALAVADELWHLSALEPGAAQATRVRRELLASTLGGLERKKSLVARTSEARDQEIVDGILALLRVRLERDHDPFMEAFGVSQDALRDARGVFSPTRLLATFYGRYRQLGDRIALLLHVLTARRLEIVSSLVPAEALLVTERPLVTLRVATRVRGLIEGAVRDDAVQAIRPLRRLKHRVDRAAASYDGVIRAVQLLDTAGTRSERAQLLLDIYRRVVEGQLRPWAWTLLQLRGSSGARMPELSALHERLIADGHPLLQEFARAVLPAARNAAAHEDFMWDDERGLLLVGDDEVTEGQLEDAIGLANAIVYGCEASWRCVRASSDVVARLLDVEDPVRPSKTIDDRLAASYFGSNGLHVRSWQDEARKFTAELDALPFSRINPCFQALMWAARVLDNVDEFTVRVVGRKQPAIEVRRDALEATFVVWSRAIGRVAAMPASVFLPANVAARLQVEDTNTAGRAAAALAANDAVNAYDEARVFYSALVPPPRLLSPLSLVATRLDIVESALEASLGVLSPLAAAPVRELLELVSPAAQWATSAAMGGAWGASAGLERQIRGFLERSPIPSVLPSFDPRPLDVVGLDPESTT